MKLRHLGAALVVLACTVSAAEARPAKKHPRPDSQAASHCEFTNGGRVVCPAGANRISGHARVTARHAGDGRANPGDPKPAKWCGWFMRQVERVADRAYNQARKWAGYGSRAHGPAVGVIVVWPHHVGKITGRKGGQWVVLSGNDGHAVRCPSVRRRILIQRGRIGNARHESAAHVARREGAEGLKPDR